jgi:hypothetical protein
MLPGSDVIAEFQRRRIQTWKAVRWWLLLAVIAGVAFALSPQGSTLELTQGQFTFLLICFVVIAVSIIVAIRAVYAYYRCPICNIVPMRQMGAGGGGGFSYRTGVDLNPSICPKCGAQLRIDS